MRVTNDNNYIDYSVECDEIIVEKLYVDEKQRNKGIATKMMKDFINEFRQDRPIALCAYPQDDKTDYNKLIEFYENLGFKVEYDDGKNGALMIYE